MQLDPFDLVQCLGSQIAFATVRATYDGNALNDQEVVSLAVATCDMTNACALSSADVAYHCVYPQPLGYIYGDDHQLACDTNLGDHNHRVASKCLAFDQVFPLT